jgi:hypothetical protein
MSRYRVNYGGLVPLDDEPGDWFRAGYELRAEVVSAENLSKVQPGHGPL